MTSVGMVDAWNAFRAGDVPPRLVKPHVLLEELVDQIASRDRSKTRAASIDASYAGINLQLRYRPVTEVDTIRFELWARRALVHARAGSVGGMRSDRRHDGIDPGSVRAHGRPGRAHHGSIRWSVTWELRCSMRTSTPPRTRPVKSGRSWPAFN